MKDKWFTEDELDEIRNKTIQESERMSEHAENEHREYLSNMLPPTIGQKETSEQAISVLR